MKKYVCALGLVAAAFGVMAMDGKPFPAAPDMPAAQNATEASIVLGGGCFWGVEAVFEHMKGVTSAVSGYAGGASDTADYKAVSSGKTAHAEVVKVTFDPSVVQVGDILKVFFSVAHDPTQLNRQGPDRGTQYRSAVFTQDAAQAAYVTSYIAAIDAAGVFDAPVVTEVKVLEHFYEAEAYHQDYVRHHPMQPYIVMHDLPKLAALKAEWPELVKPQE